MRQLVLPTTVLLLCSLGFAEPQEAETKPLKSAETITVPLSIKEGQIFVAVRINQKAARMLVDTGAGITLVESKFAKGTAELQCLNIAQQAGNSKASIRNLSITLGSLTFKDHSVGALDMTDVSRRTGTSIDGVLGEDILGGFRSVRINFKDQTLELEP